MLCMVCGDSLPDLFAIAGQKMYFCNSNFSFMENYIKKAADAFLVERPYGMRVDYRKKGFVLFNRNCIRRSEVLHPYGELLLTGK